ncbi:MAG TPA: EF-hand domain-containing protein [Reyranella sp.]|nr:EF-hand domain-containing protein [Reyranella sp.]
MTKKVLPLILILLAAAPALAAPGDETTTPRPARPSNSGVMRYDTNKDGFVDRSEWTAGQEARFKQLDIDKDGKLSKDELFSHTRQAPGAVLPNDRTLERQDAFFRRMDSDRDGTISKAEFMSQADRNFARCDTDKDGRTNTAECRQALRRPTAERVGVER